MKLKLPEAVKETFRKLNDEDRFFCVILAGCAFTRSLVPCCSSREERKDKIWWLAEIVKTELQRQEDVYLKDEDEIERLARAVEACTTDLADEVGADFDETIPKGSVSF